MGVASRLRGDDDLDYPTFVITRCVWISGSAQVPGLVLFKLELFENFLGTRNYETFDL